MGRSAKKKTRKRAAPASKVLESITDSDARSILKLLAERDHKLVEIIDATARELLGQVDTEDVATDVQMELELLDVEEVWDRSGATRDGYVDSGDAAWQMFEEALKPFEDAQLSEAADALYAAHSEAEVDVYLASLLAFEPEMWAGLRALLEQRAQ